MNLSDKAMKMFDNSTLFTEHDIRDQLSNMIDQLGTQREAAQSLGISNSYMGDILHGKRDISEKIARKLGWEKKAIFVKEAI